MATIQFSPPAGTSTVTVDVAPGERRTLLAVAREHGVPIPFDCQAGECGSCLVHVDTKLHDRMAPLSPNEASLLRLMCMLTDGEIEDAKIRGIPPAVRLACQYELRDEQIVVYFTGEPGCS
jgi:ferredoxin